MGWRSARSSDLSALLQQPSALAEKVPHILGVAHPERAGRSTWLTQEHKQRPLAGNPWVKEGYDPSDYGGPSALHSLAGMTRHADLRASGQLLAWNNLAAYGRCLLMLTTSKVPSLRRASSDTLVTSLGQASGDLPTNRVRKQAVQAIPISVDDWHSFLRFLAQRSKQFWHAEHKPLYGNKQQVHVDVATGGPLLKKRAGIAHP